MNQTFLERTFRGLFEAVEQALTAETTARRNGLLQSIDPRVKIVCFALLIVATVAAHHIAVLLALLALAAGLGAMSHVSLHTMITRIWTVVFLFSGILTLPAVFLRPNGWNTAVLLIVRAETSATFSVLLILCTPWAHVLKSLRVLGAPAMLVVLLAATYRYIFVLLRIALDMFEARQSRMVGVLSGPERRAMITSTMGVLMGKSLQLSGDVHLAMQSRGFQGEAYVLDEFQMRTTDWIAATSFTALAAVAVWVGR